MLITMELFDGVDITHPDSKIWMEYGALAYNEDDIVATPRINVQVMCVNITFLIYAADVLKHIFCMNIAVC